MLSFTAGIVGGVYIAQRYDMEKVISEFKPTICQEELQGDLWDRVKKYEEKCRRHEPSTQESTSSSMNITNDLSNSQSPPNDPQQEIKNCSSKN
ncbi:hypothetical protein C9374_001437 [Naegleria lovaniensis]|uniref:Uncharacterized protein n=1 Tax=Naegleria lovaniensis TaxID=51637 RepID=A0AA88GWW2_NAELO|nr:uncharacterized protein C9374_001437 [Naegleria lovaniensis]KAG2387843.1 hypothetical protein C9374_001437 [Naegleria lovaniensis]